MQHFFQLQSLLSFGILAGCPVAWLISNREDGATLAMFFKVVKERCPGAKIHTLMTDDGMCTIHYNGRQFTDCYFEYPDLAGANACQTVYPEVVHLLCKWHVDR